MFAILRVNSYDPERLAAAAERMAEFDDLHAAQPGFSAGVAVDVGGGRRAVLNVWDSAEAGRAGQEVLVPHVERLLVPLMSAPSRFIGAGPVVSWQVPRSAGG